jgi:phosphoribosyl 1,2-cyclic phosphodiesterase
VDAAGVKQVLMFHHDPEHDDDCLDRIEAEVQAKHPNSMMARERMVLSLKPEEALV